MPSAAAESEQSSPKKRTGERSSSPSLEQERSSAEDTASNEETECPSSRDKEGGSSSSDAESDSSGNSDKRADSKSSGKSEQNSSQESNPESEGSEDMDHKSSSGSSREDKETARSRHLPSSPEFSPERSPAQGANHSSAKSDSDSHQSDSSDASGSDSAGTAESDSAGTAGRAIEQESLEAHLERHEYPRHVSTCPSCRFAHNREKWEEQTTFEHHGMIRSWLTFHCGFLGCLICRFAGFKCPYAKGKATCKLDRALKHQTSDAHHAAVARWNAEKGNAEPGPDCHSWASQAAPAHEKGDGPMAVTYVHILFTRILVQVGGSFRDFAKWCTGARYAGAAGLESAVGRRVPKQIAEAMAEREQDITDKFAGASTSSGIAVDGRESVWAVLLHLVVWRWPRGVPRAPLPKGVTALNGDRGPWLVDRIAGAPQLGADHTAAAKTRSTLTAVRSATRTEQSQKNLRQTMRFFAGDGAGDAQLVGKSLPRHFPGLRFRMWDTSHANVLVLKNSLGGDPELDMVDQLLVSGKEPPSLSKFLSTSGRFRETFKQEEADDLVAILAHFGWAPQRFTSKVRPYTRTALRLRQAFATIAAEAVGPDHKRRQWAQHLLHELGGCHSSRLLLGGMMADLSYEHHQWVRQSDFADSDPTLIAANRDKFLARLDMLFMEGLILTEAAKDTFTGQVLVFLRQPRLLQYGSKAVSMHLPFLDGVAAASGQPAGGPAADDSIWEPLDRMRNLVLNVKEVVKVYRPEHAWQDRFHAFRLPSPWGPGLSFASMPEPARTDLRARIQADMRAVVERAEGDPEAVWSDFLRLVPSAEAHQRNGATMREAWARASFDFPELLAGRFAVDLLLGSHPSTGSVERLFREVPVQERIDRSHMLDVTLENLLLASQAPLPEEIADSITRPDGTRRLVPKGEYLPRVAKQYVDRFGAPRPVRNPKRRRDLGISRDPEQLKRQRLARNDPQTEQEFLRARDTAVKEMEQLSEQDRAQRARNSVFAGSAIPAASEDRLAQLASAKTKALRAKAQAKAEAQRKPSPDKIPQPRATKKCQWAKRTRGSGPPPGCILILRRDPDVEALARRKGFRLCFRADHFLESAHRFRFRRGHVVLDLLRPFPLQAIAGIAARLAGAFLSPETEWRDGRSSAPLGVKFKDGKEMPRRRAIAISEGVDEAVPDLSLALQAFDSWKDTKFEVMSAKKLKKQFRAELAKNERSRPWTRKRLLLLGEEAGQVSQKNQDLYPGLFNTLPTFLDFAGDVEAGAVCPGQW